MNTIQSRAGRLSVAAGLLGAALAGVGCGSGSGGHTAADVGNRPMVQETSVDASAHQEAASLAFFDDLEMRPLASQDDAVHACLLLGTGASGDSYEHRVAMAKELGYIPKNYDRPARQAVTMGEVSSMVVRILEGGRASETNALAKLVHRGIAPASAQTNQGLTGAQLVSITGGVRDAMALEGVQRVTPPSVPDPAKIAAAAEAAKASQEPALTTTGVALGEAAKGNEARIVEGPTTSTQQPPTNVHTAAAAKGRTEPLPEVPVGAAPPAIELQDPHGKGAVIGPDQKVITPGQKDKKADGKPAWVTGQPIKQPSSGDQPK